MRRVRLITAGLAAGFVLAITPAWAAAASPLVDDSVADFSGPESVATDTWAVEPGSVQLKRTDLSESFDGTTLPAGWTQGLWDPAGAATVASGALTVDGARANTNDPPMSTAPQTLEYRAVFGGDAFQHVGFGTDFNDGPWAMFSTGDGSLPGLYARTRTGPGQTSVDTPIADVDPTQPHTYRIEWSATEVRYYVDGGAPKVTTPLAAPISLPMRAIASDLTPAGAAVTVDWLAMGSSSTSGTFVSRVHDAGDPRAVWGTLTAAVTGGDAAIETRSGKTATPDATWSDFQPLGAGNAIQGPSGRYIQYRATLNSATPGLDSVSIEYVIDDVKPVATIDGAQVSGSTAMVTFSSPAADLAGFDCSLDGGVYAPCTSPKEFPGLAAGSHTVSVQPVDKAGNVGDAVTRTFTIDSPAPGGGNSTLPAVGDGQAVAPDTTAPVMTVGPLSKRASKSGSVAVRVGCPATETSCKVRLALKRGRTTAARKTITVTGGKAVKVALRLTKAARLRLAKHGHLSVKAVITATDAAGNRSTTTSRITLRSHRRPLP